MSKWTAYQLLVCAVFTLLIVINNVFAAQLVKLFSFISSFIAPSIVIIFFTVILVIWGFSIMLLLQEKKGKPLFVHKIWRIMPAIIGVVLLLSIIAFITLGVTVSADVIIDMRWVLDISVIYFLVLFYLLILSIMLRYGRADTNKGLIMTSANIAVITVIIVLFLIPYN